MGEASARRGPDWLDLAVPADAALDQPGPLRPSHLDIRTQAAVTDLIRKLSVTWSQSGVSI
jgi:hypothetical protein